MSLAVSFMLLFKASAVLFPSQGHSEDTQLCVCILGSNMEISKGAWRTVASTGTHTIFCEAQDCGDVRRLGWRMTLGGLVGSQVAWDWLFGEDLVGWGKEVLPGVHIVPTGRQSGKEL